MKRIPISTATLAAFLSIAMSAMAQMPVPPPVPGGQLLASGDIDQLLQPIALYPDPLIAQILPAATQPMQVVLAARYVFGGGDMNQIDFQPWDPSIKAIARYPDVLRMMDQRLDWTTQLGQAFIYQQVDVMNAIQRLRFQAQMLGNLQTTPQQYVVADNGVIEIVPVNPEIIYVPMYRPEMVFVRRGFFLSFGVGFSIGLWLDHDCDWHHHDVIIWGRDHPRPHDWWSRPSHERFASVIVNNRISVANRNVTVWRPPARTTVTIGNRADRGWDTRDVRPASRAAEIHAPGPVITERRQPTPQAVQRTAPAPSARSYGGAFVGGETAHDARAASSRGQQSREAISRPAPPPRSTAPAAKSHESDTTDRKKH